MEATETAGDENGKEAEAEEDDGRLSCLAQERDCPGSPSFRVFFIDESLGNINEG